jgi:hypothetical protein
MQTKRVKKRTLLERRQDKFEEYQISPFSEEDQIHCLYYVPCTLLVSMREEGTLKNWSRNRKPNMQRVVQIRKYQNAHNHVNGTIHFAFLDDEGLVCYEGNHRFHALTDSVDGVLIDVMWTTTTTNIRQEFNTINKAERVAEALTDKNAEKRLAITQEVQDFVEDLCRVYPTMIGKGNRSNRPRFLVDDFIDKIVNLHKHFSTRGYTLDNIFTALNYLNACYGNGERTIKYEKRKGLGEKSLALVEESGFYLYCSSDPLNISDVKWALENAISNNT